MSRGQPQRRRARIVASPLRPSWNSTPRAIFSRAGADRATCPAGRRKGSPSQGAAAEHNIQVDREGNVWLGGSARGDSIQKFTSDGKLLWDFGHRGPRTPAGQQAQPLKENNQNTDTFPGGIFFFDLDEDAHELYIVEQKRVLVYDMDTGAFKRGWGGHGIPLSEINNDPTPPYDWKSGPPPDQKEFAPALHCVHISKDGLVYICERGSDRVQVFTKQGKFVSSFFVHPSTPSRGPECGGPGSTPVRNVRNDLQPHLFP